MGGDFNKKEERIDNTLISIKNNSNFQFTQMSQEDILDKVSEQILDEQDNGLESTNHRFDNLLTNHSEELLENYEELREENEKLREQVNQLSKKHKNINSRTLILLEEKKRKIEKVHDSVKKINNIYEEYLSSKKFYTDKVRRLQNELSQSENVLSDFKKIIKNQREELDQRKLYSLNLSREIKKNDQKHEKILAGFQEIIRDNKKSIDELKSVVKLQKLHFDKNEQKIQDLKNQRIELTKELAKHRKNTSNNQIKQLLDEKHDLIQNIHEITKELNLHYSTKLVDYHKIISKIKRDKVKKEDESNKILSELKKQFGENNQLKQKFTNILRYHEEELKDREKILKQVVEQNKALKHDMEGIQNKATMYEEIALKAKNESIALHDEFNESFNDHKDIKENHDLSTKKISLLNSEINTHKKQNEVIKKEYEKRVQRIKQKHEQELKELISIQTRNELTLKSQVYSLTQDYEELEKEFAREKQKQQQIAKELNQKLTTIFKPVLDTDSENDEQIIYNVPREIKEDYQLYDSD